MRKVVWLAIFAIFFKIKFFNVTQYAVREAREIKKGISSSTVKYCWEGVIPEIKLIIINFYKRQVSRMCPGKT